MRNKRERDPSMYARDDRVREIAKEGMTIGKERVKRGRGAGWKRGGKERKESA